MVGANKWCSRRDFRIPSFLRSVEYDHTIRISVG